MAQHWILLFPFKWRLADNGITGKSQSAHISCIVESEQTEIQNKPPKRSQSVNIQINKNKIMPGSGRSPGEGNGNPLQYSCLENPMDRGAWQTTCPWGHKESDLTEQLTH